MSRRRQTLWSMVKYAAAAFIVSALSFGTWFLDGLKDKFDAGQLVQLMFFDQIAASARMDRYYENRISEIENKLGIKAESLGEFAERTEVQENP